jgi:hypothetical protein
MAVFAEFRDEREVALKCVHERMQMNEKGRLTHRQALSGRI